MSLIPHAHHHAHPHSRWQPQMSGVRWLVPRRKEYGNDSGRRFPEAALIVCALTLNVPGLGYTIVASLQVFYVGFFKCQRCWAFEFATETRTYFATWIPGNPSNAHVAISHVKVAPNS